MTALQKTRMITAWVTCALMLVAIIYALAIGIANWSEIMV